MLQSFNENHSNKMYTKCLHQDSSPAPKEKEESLSFKNQISLTLG